jgi:uncharacterized protein (TIGR00251 family)
VSFSVRVQPRASRDELGGERAGVLLVRLKAPPLEGAANAALVRFLAKSLGVPVSAVAILRGASQRNKLVRVRGIRGSQVLALAGR